MDLISWSVNAIDQNFSTQRQGMGEPTCPDGTHASGYGLDAWGKRRILCLSQMSVKDVEDLYIFGFMIIGFLLFGAGGYLLYRKIERLLAETGKLFDGCMSMCRAIGTQTQTLNELSRKLDAVSELNSKLSAVLGLIREIDSNLTGLIAQLDGKLN